MGTGKTHVGKMDAVLPDSDLHARTKTCIMINNAVVTKLEYTEERKRSATLVQKQPETIQTTAARKYEDAQVRRVLQH